MITYQQGVARLMPLDEAGKFCVENGSLCCVADGSVRTQSCSIRIDSDEPIDLGELQPGQASDPIFIPPGARVEVQVGPDVLAGEIMAGGSFWKDSRKSTQRTAEAHQKAKEPLVTAA